MSTVRLVRLAAVACLCLVLVGCASTREATGKAWQVIRDPSIPVGYPEERPSLVDLSMVAEPNANPNADGEGTPLRFQILQLKDDSMLMAADLGQLQRDLEEALGTNYLTHDDFTLLPGQWKFYELRGRRGYALHRHHRVYASPNEAEWKRS